MFERKVVMKRSYVVSGYSLQHLRLDVLANSEREAEEFAVVHWESCGWLDARVIGTVQDAGRRAARTAHRSHRPLRGHGSEANTHTPPWHPYETQPRRRSRHGRRDGSVAWRPLYERARSSKASIATGSREPGDLNETGLIEARTEPWAYSHTIAL